MAMSGADSDALDRVGVQLERAGRSLDRKRQRLRSSIHAAPWRGPGADRFRREFDSVHARAMADAARFLDDAYETLVRNAREQRRASDAGGAALSHRFHILVIREIGRWVDRFPWLRYVRPGGVPVFWPAGPLGPPPFPWLLGEGLGRLFPGGFGGGVGSAGGLGWAGDALVGMTAAGTPITLLSGRKQAGGTLLEGDFATNWKLPGGDNVTGQGWIGRWNSGADGDVTLGRDGLDAQGRAGIGGELIGGQLDGRVGSDDLGATGQVRATVEASANADANAHIGADGVKAAVGASAFAGAKATASAKGNFFGIKPSAEASGYAGAGAHAGAEVSVSPERIKIQANLGGALKIGGGVKVGVEVEPVEVAKNIGKAWHRARGWL